MEKGHRLLLPTNRGSNSPKSFISFNGSRIRPRTMGYIFAGFVLLIVLLPFLSVIFSNLVFPTDYEGMEELKDDYIKDWQADDPKLIAHIQKHYLYPPSPKSEPYDLLSPEKKDWSHKRQSSIVAEILQDRRNGFFLEAGAYDGETYSNTLSFEKYLGWTGVLVEPDYSNLKKLLSKKRKAWTIQGCLDGTRTPEKLTLYGAMETGSLAHYMNPTRKLLTWFWRPVKKTQVWCFPLQSVLLAVNHTKVDYMVLDVEGAEMPILKGTPWDKFDVDVLQVEYMVFQGTFWDKDLSKKRRQEMRKFLKETLPQMEEHSVVFLDMIYAKKGLAPSGGKKKHED